MHQPSRFGRQPFVNRPPHRHLQQPSMTSAGLFHLWYVYVHNLIAEVRKTCRTPHGRMQPFSEIICLVQSMLQGSVQTVPGPVVSQRVSSEGHICSCISFVPQHQGLCAKTAREVLQVIASTFPRLQPDARPQALV